MYSNFDLDRFQPDIEPPITKLITLEGNARSGKGTTGKALTEALDFDGRSVLTIDQGKKFRALACVALQEGVDVDAAGELTEFLEAPTTSVSMLDFLAGVATMSPDDEQVVLYSREVGDASGKVGSNPASHAIAIRLMREQVAQAASNKTDTVLVDGRALEKYGFQMSAEGMVIYAAGFYFECDPLTAARRVRKELRPISELTTKEKLQLLEEAESIRIRNDKDAKREVDPFRYPHQAFSLDLLNGLPRDPKKLQKMIDEIINTKIVSVNTSHTSCEQQMTGPIVTIVRSILDAADVEHDLWLDDPSRFESDIVVRTSS